MGKLNAITHYWIGTIGALSFVFALFFGLVPTASADVTDNIVYWVDNSSLILGRGTTYASYLGTTFATSTESVWVYSIKMRLARIGAPQDSIRVSFNTNLNSSNPCSGDTYTYIDIPGSSLSTSLTAVYMDLFEIVPLPRNTELGICVYRTGGDDASNYYSVGYKTTDGDPETTAWSFVQSVGWTSYTDREYSPTGIFGTLGATELDPPDAWLDYTTSTDPYAEFEAYSSSSFAFADPDFGKFGNALVSILKYIFVAPIQSVRSWFFIQLENARYRQPQGYIFRFLELHDEISSAYSADPDRALPISINLPGQTTSTANILEADAFDVDLSGFRTLSTYLFWILAVWVMYEECMAFIHSLKA